MEKRYKRLTLDERIIIEKQLALGLNPSQIATLLCRNRTTIYRDIKQCKEGQYSAMQATFLSVYKSSDRKSGKSKMSQNNKLYDYVVEKLNLYWSPEQIHMELMKDFPEDKAMRLATESIYFYIYVHAKPELKAALIEQLRQKRKYRGNVRRGKDKRTTIADKISIEERPEEVKGRLIPGHWEGDLIMGKDRQSAIGTLNERTTRTVILVHLKARDAASVRQAFEKEFKSIPQQMKQSLTYDNGTEMAQHKLFTKNTKIAVYFAHPYSPWERPTNENSNGLLRDYFPKGMDLSKVSKKRLKEVQNQLNERPRKVLGWRKPKEVFDEFIMQKINNN
ncbi:MAG TPA: IS30 family transposase [Candidatus Nitrosocosmicus sp.]|nr:IS30 family transposase [Candidatus Nitrosocosmicus sp.]